MVSIPIGSCQDCTDTKAVAFSSLRPELHELRRLYDVARVASAHLKNSIKINSKKSDSAGFEKIFDAYDVSIKGAKRSLRKDHLRLLREILFVRVISLVEAFLVDTIRWLFMHRTDLFHRDEKLEISYRELLASES